MANWMILCWRRCNNHNTQLNKATSRQHNKSVMKNIPNLYRDAVIGRYPNAQNLRMPVVAGSQNNVIYAEIAGKTRVFKFGSADSVKKNAQISKLYKMHKIPCPQINIGEYNSLFFEEYELLPGTTLFEAIQNGMEANKIKQIYREIIEYFSKMDRIPGYIISDIPNKHAHEFAKQHITNTNGATLGQICMALVYMLNIGNNKNDAVYHSDITPKNTIVSADGHLVGFIDMDSVVVCNVNYAFGMLAAKYIQMGFDINELINIYNKFGTKKLSPKRIAFLADGMNFVKKQLWEYSNNKQK